MTLYSYIRPIIKGKVGDKEAYFLLDTGTNLALIDSTQADEHNLEKLLYYFNVILKIPPKPCLLIRRRLCLLLQA